MGEGGPFVKTFIPGLDDVLPGFPRGGIILVSGLPGTGKTSFGMSFIYYGAVGAGERGVYVSTYESGERFLENARAFGMDFERLEDQGLVKFIPLPVLQKTGVARSFNMVLEQVEQFEAKRLVIDSFTVLKEGFKSPHEARILLQSIFSGTLERLRCTTLLIKERAAIGEEVGFEDYVADAVIHLETTFLEDRRLRRMNIEKLRGGVIRHPRVCFTIFNGFKVLPPTKPLQIKGPMSFSPPPDPPEGYTTGIPELDREIGGYPMESTVLLEIDPRLTPLDYEPIFLPAAGSFVLRGRPVIGVPSGGVTVEFLKEAATLYGVSEDDFLKYCIFFVEATAPMENLPNIVKIDAKEYEKAAREVIDYADGLIKKFGKPVFVGVGVDRLIRACGGDAAINFLSMTQEYIKHSKGLMIWIVKPIEPWIVEKLAPIADMHFKITRRHGCALLYGIKPGTPIFALQRDPEAPLPNVIPIV